MKFALIAALAVSVLMAFFAAQNSQHAQVTFMGWYFDAPLVIILTISFGAGILATFLAMIPGALSKSIRISKLNSVIAENEAKIEAFKKQLQESKIQEK
jgi:uncharacterized integral membrane protein